jgi:hypothetical protein
LKNGYKGPLKTVLLKDVRPPDDSQVYTDHLWFNLTKGFEALNLKEGDVVQFDARVKKYQKGYMGRQWPVDAAVEWDYKLSHPTHIRKLNKNE